MKYTIFSIDNSRDKYKRDLRSKLGSGEIQTECINGYNPEELSVAINTRGYDINFPKAKVGHLGIWYTVLNALDEAPIITFEDDALLHQNFTSLWRIRSPHIPADFDFFSLFLPRDSDHMFNKDMAVNKYVTRAYQRYGGVSMYYSETGAHKIKELLTRDGITGQYDDTLYAYSKAGELNGYCSRPDQPDLVYITGLETSIVQESPKYA